MGDVSRDIDPKTRPRDDDPQGQRRWDKMKEVHDYLAQMARSLEAFQAWRVREETTSGPPSSAQRSVYVYGGVRALVRLHERHLRTFVAQWKWAVADGVALPPSDDPDCASLDAMLRHVLRAARGYLVWTCRSLGLPDPAIDPVPEDLPTSLDAYVEHLLDRLEPVHGRHISIPLDDADATEGYRG